MSWLLLLGLCASTGGLSAGAPGSASLQVRVEVTTSAPELEGGTVSVRATPYGSNGTSPQRHESRELRLAVPGSGSLSLDKNSFWVLEAIAPGFFAPKQQLSPQALTGGVRFKMLPAGVAAGRLVLASGEPRLSEITLRFEPVPTLAPKTSRSGPITLAEKRFLGTTTECPVSESEFHCAAPAGRVDLSLRAPGFVSHFFWNREVPAGGSLDLGTLQLRRGASIAGWVETTGQAVAMEQCEVELEPVSAGGPPRLMESERAKLRSRTLRADERGFFHFSGIEPGAYRLTARHPAFAPTSHEGLTVSAGAEVRLAAPLLLQPASRLEVWISPAADPEGEPWRLELWKRGASGGLRTPVTAKPEPAPDGHWQRSGLSAGRHWLRVLDKRGQAFALRELDVSPNEPPLFVTLDPTPIEGVLKLGGEPIAGSIFFGGRRGSESVRIEADEEGAFAGTLPRSGSWVVEIVAKERKVDRWLRDVHVRALEGGGPAHIALTLPATTLTGRVLRESGAAAAGARVTIVRRDEVSAPILLAARHDGRFETAGAAPGDYQVEAEGEAGEADPVTVSLDEKRQGKEIELVLRRRRELSGRLVFGDAGVRAARVTALPLLGGLEPFTSPQLAAVSDETGAFSLKLPRWADGVALVVQAPGFALRQIRLHPLPEDEVALPLAQDGGTLQWTIQGGFSPQSPADAMPTLYGAGGMVLSLGLLRDWSNLHGIQAAEMGELTELTIPNLEPGTYAACWFETREAGWSAARDGRWPKSRCSSVTLSAFGTADLTVVAPERPQQHRESKPKTGPPAVGRPGERGSRAGRWGGA